MGRGRHATKLPRNIRKVRDGYQARVTIAGERVPSRVVPDIETAIRVRDLMEQRGDQFANQPERSLEEAAEVGINRAETDGSRRWLRTHMRAVYKFIPADSRLDGITVEHVERLRDESMRSVSATTTNHRLTALRLVLNIALREGWCLQNVASTKLVRRPRARRTKMDYFAADEFVALLARVGEYSGPRATSRRMVAWMTTLVMTGMRRAEFSRSVVTDWNLSARTLFIDGKCDGREIPFGNDLLPQIEYLIENAKDDGRIAPSADVIGGEFLTWNRRVREPRLHPHALRHTYATSLVRAGVDIETVRHLLGHETIAMTMKYFHVCGVAAQNAVEALQLSPQAPRSDRG